MPYEALEVGESIYEKGLHITKDTTVDDLLPRLHDALQQGVHSAAHALDVLETAAVDMYVNVLNNLAQNVKEENY